MIGEFLRVCARLSLALFVAIPLARAQEGRVWMFSVEEGGPRLAHLAYGVPETDDSFGSFRCETRSGSVTFFLSETDAKLKAGARAAAVLSVGAAQTKIAGKLLANEEAGVPSFEGRISVDDPIFAAMAGGGTLVAAIGAAKQSAPLAGAAEKVGEFVDACKKR